MKTGSGDKVYEAPFSFLIAHLNKRNTPISLKGFFEAIKKRKRIHRDAQMFPPCKLILVYGNQKLNESL